MESRTVEKAPAWRVGLAGLIDFAGGMALTWFMRRRSSERRGLAAAVPPARYRRLVGPAGELLRTQLGSPGQRLLGLRTADKRTGQRVTLWRSLTVMGFALAGGELLRRVAAPPLEDARRVAVSEEVHAIQERHEDDPQARHEAMEAHFREHRNELNMARSVGPPVAVGLLGNLLRRRLMPTVQVRTGGE
jgi:hypothetical protein